MNAFLNIETDTRSNVFAVPQAAVTTDTRGSFINTLNPDGSQTELPVDVGLKTSARVEIEAEGLREGMQVVLPTVVSAPSGMGFGMFGRGGF